VRVVVAPDSFGGRLTAREATDAIAHGWTSVRPADEVVRVPMSDGGEGLLDVVHRPQDRRVDLEVCGPAGLPVEAWFSLRDDGTAVVESAMACGLHLVDDGRRNPMLTTTYGVGQLLDAARESGASRILVGLGGSATVDGGAGALTGLGFRLRVADGSGLKIGGHDLHRVASAERGWAADWDGIEVVLLADVRTTLHDAPRLFGPQKGADEQAIDVLEAGLAAWAEVAAHDLADAEDLATTPGSGAAGGLGFGLAAGLGARFTDGAATVADLVGLHEAMVAADLVITGEGRLDATSFDGKVVGAVTDLAERVGTRVAALVGAETVHTARLQEVLEAPADTPDEAAMALRGAAATLARRENR
jgi:glycerate 2-kinase